MQQYDITSSSLLPLHPYLQQSPQTISSDQQSQASTSSCGTVHLYQDHKPFLSPDASGSVSSFRLRVINENMPMTRYPSRSSQLATPTPASASFRRRNQEDLRVVSTWMNESPSRARPNSATILSPDTSSLVDVDLRSIHPDECAEDVRDCGPSSIAQSHNILGPPGQSSDTSHRSALAKSFDTAPNHPFKHNRPFIRWVGTMRKRRNERTRSLTIREVRWDLDDSGEKINVKRHPGQRRRQQGHQRSSSWSPFGFISNMKSLADSPNSSVVPHSQGSRKKGFLKNHRKSLNSESTKGSSRDNDCDNMQIIDQPALDRAKLRQRVLTELLGSEESYVADLKVLLHVGKLNETNYYLQRC